MSNPRVDENDGAPGPMDTDAASGIKDPPRTMGGYLTALGPGMIIAGAVVGSGELIATTKVGAQAGIWLLWLIIVGCVIKVFVQIELGRHTISHSETPLAALDKVPGPRARVNWIIWYWLVMMIVLLGTIGGIVGGVGQALALTFPLTGDYVRTIRVPSHAELTRYVAWADGDVESRSELSQQDVERFELGHAIVHERIEALGDEGRMLVEAARELSAARYRLNNSGTDADVQGADESSEAVRVAEARLAELTSGYTTDDRIWALLVTVVTIGLLCYGRYGLIEKLSIVLVVAFTIVTVGNVIVLQFRTEFALSIDDYLKGLSLHVPPGREGFATAMATFGMIGVGATELLMYPYWCLEKGYGRFTGPRSSDDGWARRARGWMMVMHYDAFASMALYTVATLAFFILGVAVLHRQGLDPEGMRMVSTLLEQYVPVFGPHAKWVFLSGAITVLYSTYLVANAAFARMFTDATKLFGLIDSGDARVHDRAVTGFSILLPSISLGVYCMPDANPVALVLLGGVMEGIMLPMLAFGALYFRFRKADPRIAPGKLWDSLLILSSIGLLIAGAYIAYESIMP